jgi:hypothetical protein
VNLPDLWDGNEVLPTTYSSLRNDELVEIGMLGPLDAIFGMVTPFKDFVHDLNPLQDIDET